MGQRSATSLAASDGRLDGEQALGAEQLQIHELFIQHLVDTIRAHIDRVALTDGDRVRWEFVLGTTIESSPVKEFTGLTTLCGYTKAVPEGLRMALALLNRELTGYRQSRQLSGREIAAIRCQVGSRLHDVAVTTVLSGLSAS